MLVGEDAGMTELVGRRAGTENPHSHS
jgi:hypothetical protein